MYSFTYFTCVYVILRNFRAGNPGSYCPLFLGPRSILDRRVHYFQVPRRSKWIGFHYFQVLSRSTLVDFQYFQIPRNTKWVDLQYFQVPRNTKFVDFQYFQVPEKKSAPRGPNLYYFYWTSIKNIYSQIDRNWRIYNFEWCPVGF